MNITSAAPGTSRPMIAVASKPLLRGVARAATAFGMEVLVANRPGGAPAPGRVDLDELLAIEGVDEGTAGELQARARDVIEEQNRKAIEAATALGVEQSLFDFEGLTPQMIEALAKDDVKTLEDFATCADWELAGGWTTVDGARHKDEGILEKFDMSLEEAQALIMTARVQLGWVDPTEMEVEEEEAYCQY